MRFKAILTIIIKETTAKCHSLLYSYPNYNAYHNSQLSTQNIDSSVSDVNSSRAFIPMMELPFELSRGLHTAME